MKTKIKLISISIIFSTATAIASPQPWEDKTEILKTYKAGTEVIDNGIIYQCKPWPYSEWCQSAAYRPSGMYGANSWEKKSDPQPLDQQRTLTIALPDNLPNNAIIEFIDPNGGIHKVANNQVTLTYAKGGSDYTIKLEGGTGEVSPTNYTVTETSKSPVLSYKEAPTPPAPATQCKGEVPSDAPEWKKPSAWPNDHYDGNTFVSYKNGIWQAKWWTNSAPDSGDGSWTYCQSQTLGTLNVTVSGLNDFNQFPLKLNDKTYTISKNGAKLQLGKGNYNATVDTIVNVYDMHAYLPTITPSSFTIDKKGDYPLNIAFNEKAIGIKSIGAQVEFAEGTSPNPLPIATIAGEGYSASQQLKSNNNDIKIPEYGSYTITPASYNVDGKKYVANSLNVIDAMLINGNKIKYQPDNRVLAGYMPVSWNQPVKISEAAKQGYNIALPSFIIVDGGKPVKFVDDHFLAYSTWNNSASDPQVIEKIKTDIELAKTQYGLKYVLASIGGERNTFNPAGAPTQLVADQVISFLKTYNFDGIDFDLEVVPRDVTKEYLVEFIEALKAEMPNIIISGAPQVNNVGGTLQYVNTQTDQVYNAAIEKGLFNYLFVQEYNTGGNYVCADGSLGTKTQAGCYDQTSAKFIINSFYALKKITPKNTLIIAGQPATASAAGAATVYNGADKDDPYNAMANAYKALSNEPQFGGAMTWELSLDATNNYQFIKSIKPVISN
ncbi:glycosyl hydrolase family 18 protein [Fastidiosibacter lacustris]|uniref:glycosyl hydrolase family 18 protein n=1 Tax=Fastidiosibacter lacustris TaxID=2056695 RepID=UPI000E3525CA|nr:glycosyl hydrolase family 18 protein [Fastidiosibacter lacustris]